MPFISAPSTTSYSCHFGIKQISRHSFQVCKQAEPELAKVGVLSFPMFNNYPLVTWQWNIIIFLGNPWEISFINCWIFYCQVSLLEGTPGCSLDSGRALIWSTVSWTAGGQAQFAATCCQANMIYGLFLEDLCGFVGFWPLRNPKWTNPRVSKSSLGRNSDAPLAWSSRDLKDETTKHRNCLVFPQLSMAFGHP